MGMDTEYGYGFRTTCSAEIDCISHGTLHAVHAELVAEERELCLQLMAGDVNPHSLARHLQATRRRQHCRHSRGPRSASSSFTLHPRTGHPGTRFHEIINNAIAPELLNINACMHTVSNPPAARRRPSPAVGAPGAGPALPYRHQLRASTAHPGLVHYGFTVFPTTSFATHGQCLFIWASHAHLN